MASDGSSQTRLTNSTGTDAASRYSLDGAKIVFVSNRHNPVDPNLDLDVYSMNTDGTSQARITMGASITTPPSIGSGAAPPGSGMALADVPISFLGHRTDSPLACPGLPMPRAAMRSGYRPAPTRRSSTRPHRRSLWAGMAIRLHASATMFSASWATPSASLILRPASSWMKPSCRFGR